MSLYTEILTIPGAPLGGENPLPIFKSQERSHPSRYDDTFRQEDKTLFGWETGFRVLPYRMQDTYSRKREKMKLKTIVLENEHLKAVFLPEYGGRLASLKEIDSGRELLFRNPVFQPANLAVRDAWFSGGIEWNIGQFGHSVFTCSPLYFAGMEDSSGNHFLRAWEFERTRKIFSSLDFHLPPGARQLAVYVRIINDNATPVPMYWWTNIAVPEEKNLRVFSGSDDVIYIKPESNMKEGSDHYFGRAPITKLPSLPGKDPSYPANFDFSSEYFFQTPEETISPWEAAVYNDGTAFFERSTSALRYRKMFCWGKHRGGKHWCDYLSEPGKGDYVEIQAGIASTQIHGLKMEGNSVWEFTQLFGGMNITPVYASGEWNTARDRVEEAINRNLPPDKVNELHEGFRKYRELKPREILHSGSGWGALEMKRREIAEKSCQIPGGIHFPESSLGTLQKPWLLLLEEGRLPSVETGCPDAWMTDQSWLEPLKKASEAEKDNPWPLIHLGVLLYEGDRKAEAEAAWKMSIRIKETAIAWRNIARAEDEREELEKAVKSMLISTQLEGGKPAGYLSREMMELYIRTRRFNEAWEYYKNLPENVSAMERITALAAQAAFETGHEEFLKAVFEKEFAYIKEGETKLVDLWYAYSVRRIAHVRNVPMDETLNREVHRTCPPPSGIDFMMS